MHELHTRANMLLKEENEHHVGARVGCAHGSAYQAGDSPKRKNVANDGDQYHTQSARS